MTESLPGSLLDWPRLAGPHKKKNNIHSHSHSRLSCPGLWTVRGSWRTQREPTQVQGEHSNFTHRMFVGLGLNHDLLAVR